MSCTKEKKRWKVSRRFLRQPPPPLNLQQKKTRVRVLWEIKPAKNPLKVNAIGRVAICRL